MGSNVNQWKPVLGDRRIRQFDMGANGAAGPWDFKIMAGCALSGVGTETLTIASGRVKCGGFLVDFNGDTYPTPRKSETDYLYFELNLTKNSDNEVIGISYDFALNDTDASTADFYFKVAEVAVGVANIATIDEGTDNTWYPRPSIKILPPHFKANETGASVATVQGAAAAPITVTSTSATADIFAGYDIPHGLKATLVDVWASANNTFNVLAGDVTGANSTALGGGTCNTQLNITDLSHDAIAYMAIEVRNINSVSVYGGRITLELLAA